MHGQGHIRSKASLIASGTSVLTIGLAVLLFALLLLAANRGLDYSDESYSYLWARYPFEYRFALRLSGFFLHPIELLVQHSMTGFRIMGMLLTAAGGVLIAIAAINSADRTPGPLERTELIATCGIAMFLGNVQWTNTPSYQHMTVWGLVLLFTGFAMLLRKTPPSDAQRLWTALLIAGGGLILAAAKIPAAMAAAVVTLVMVLVAGGPDGAARWRMLGLIALVEIALLAAVAVFVSPFHIVDVIREGLSLRSGYGGLSDVLLKHLVDIAGMPARYVLLVAIIAASVLVVLASSSFSRGSATATSVAAIVLAIVAAYVALGFVARLLSGRHDIYYQGVQMTLLALALLALAAVISRRMDSKFQRKSLLLAIIAIPVPWIAGVGTGNNFLAHTAVYSGFSGLAIVLACMEMPQPFARGARLLVVFISAATLYVAAQHPYRLNRPIAQQSVPVALAGLNGGTLLLDAPTAELFTALRHRARSAGLTPSTPLFDLAGYGPGFNLALGTKPPVYPWIAAGYPNSPAILDKIWSLTPEADRKRAWVIGPVHESFRGADALAKLPPLDSNYELILKIAEPQTGMNIELWRPRIPAAGML